MSTGFVTLTQLLKGMPVEEQAFLEKSIKRDRNPDGSDKGIVRQMQNDICQKCHSEFKEKYPGKPFAIKCHGINDQQRFLEKQAQMKELGEEMTIEEIRDIYDPAYWVSKNIVVKTGEGDYIPMPLRWFQTEALSCTSPRKVDRWSRGLGKTSTGIGEELHMAMTRKKIEIMIVCPQQTQAEMWYMGILEQLDNSAPLAGVLAQQKQSPYYFLRFNNGSIIKIFTAGSGSGKKGGAMRGQNPRRIRLDEQDYLAEGDYDAIMPLLRRFKELTFHGSSTPTGLRGMYYQMCRVFPEYKEFFHPIMDHPDWTEDQRENYMLEAKTMDRFIHEFLAEFGDPKAGVFKAFFLDKALLPGYMHKDARPNPSKRYVMGVDWNGKGTGTRIYIVEYDTTTRKRRCVDRSVIDDPTATTSRSIAEITRLNKKWMCDYVYVDAGFGFAQDELLRGAGVVGKAEGDLQTFKLKNIKVIDFGGTLEFNKLVPNREIGEKKVKGDEEEIKRRTKPFMVEGAVMAFEEGLVELSSDDDKLLDTQMRGYRVKTWSTHGTPASYETDAESGDHDLDAFMLALLGIEIEYGLFRTQAAVRRLAQIVHVAGWGLGPSAAAFSSSSQIPSTSPAVTSEEVKSVMARRSGVQSRTPTAPAAPQGRVLHNGRGAMMIGGLGANKSAPAASGRVPSRTGNFGSRSGPSGQTFGMSPFANIGTGIRFNR
jgi:hypothetical protein